MQKVLIRLDRAKSVQIIADFKLRRTEWMQFDSLADFLNPNDPIRTIEGYPAPAPAPAPKRALLLAQNP